MIFKIYPPHLLVSAILRSGRNKAKTKKSKKKKDFLDSTSQKDDDHSMT